MEHLQGTHAGQVRKTVRWPLWVILGTGLVLFVAGLVARPGIGHPARLAVVGGAALAVAVSLAAVRLRRRWLPRLLAACEEHTDALDSLPERRIGGWVALAGERRPVHGIDPDPLASVHVSAVRVLQECQPAGRLPGAGHRLRLRPATITEGTNVLVGLEPERIITEGRKALHRAGTYHRVPELWDGRAASRIVDILLRGEMV
jgi:hypothetical protein